MRHRRRVANAKDIGRIAGKGLQDGYVGFELLEYVFDFFWSVEAVRTAIKFQITKQLETDKDSMPLNSKATLRLDLEVSIATTGVTEMTLHSKPISSITVAMESTRSASVTTAEADFPSWFTNMSDTPSTFETASVIAREHATQVMPPTASRTAIP